MSTTPESIIEAAVPTQQEHNSNAIAGGSNAARVNASAATKKERQRSMEEWFQTAERLKDELRATRVRLTEVEERHRKMAEELRAKADTTFNEINARTDAIKRQYEYAPADAPADSLPTGTCTSGASMSTAASSSSAVPQQDAQTMPTSACAALATDLHAKARNTMGEITNPEGVCVALATDLRARTSDAFAQMTNPDGACVAFATGLRAKMLDIVDQILRSAHATQRAARDFLAGS